MDEEQIQTEQVAEEPKETPAPEPEETAEKVETTEDVEPVKPKKTARERINEMNRKMRDAERERDYWRDEAIKKGKQPDAQPTPAPSDRPRLDQFETTEQYEDALFAWRDQKRESETREAKRKEEFEKSLRSFNERANAVREVYEDFDEVAENIPLTDPLREALAASENGPELVYYLGTHAAEHTKILNLPPVQQLVELGKLETKLLIAKQTKKAPAAPPPIKPVGMGSGGREKAPSEMSDEEYFRWEEQQRVEKIRRAHEQYNPRK